jgi:hypothetical protein
MRPVIASAGDDPTAGLPQQLPTADEVERELLELGGALVSLRRRGYALRQARSSPSTWGVTGYPSGSASRLTASQVSR